MDLLNVFNNSLQRVSFTFPLRRQFPKVRDASEKKTQPHACKIIKIGAGSSEVWAATFKILH